MSDSYKLIGIVDDEASIRVALTRLCSAFGLNPQPYASAQELFDSLREGRRPDCLILDVHMPGMSGLEILEWLRERSYTIPTVMITGREDEQLRARSLALGAHAYLFKPVTAETLLNAIRNAVGPG
ncbi:MAG: response regulator transcription factor [Gemmatimonadaceae bacterium]